MYYLKKDLHNVTHIYLQNNKFMLIRFQIFIFYSTLFAIVV